MAGLSTANYWGQMVADIGDILINVTVIFFAVARIIFTMARIGRYSG